MRKKSCALKLGIKVSLVVIGVCAMLLASTGNAFATTDQSWTTQLFAYNSAPLDATKRQPAEIWLTLNVQDTGDKYLYNYTLENRQGIDYIYSFSLTFNNGADASYFSKVSGPTGWMNAAFNYTETAGYYELWWFAQSGKGVGPGSPATFSFESDYGPYDKAVVATGAGAWGYTYYTNGPAAIPEASSMMLAFSGLSGFGLLRFGTNRRLKL